jgi:hypothetical protein
VIGQPPSQTTYTFLTQNMPLSVNVGTDLHSFVQALNITDTSPGAIKGIAVTGTDTTNGAWQYSLDGGTTWQGLATTSAMMSVPPSPTNAILLADSPTDRVRFVPTLNFPAPAASGMATLMFVAWDQTTGVDGGTADTTVPGSTAFSTQTGTATVTVKLNTAPDLPSGTMATLPTLQANAGSGAANPGRTVHDLITPLPITDPDELAVKGIAVIGVDNSHGTWQFSINNGATWNLFNSPSPSLALLLPDSTNNRIRFVPAANYFGQSTFMFRAWDQSSGANAGDGATGDTTTSGGSTAFSSGVGTATIIIGLPSQDLVGRDSTTGHWFVSVSNGSSAFEGPVLWDGWSVQTPTFHWVDVMTGDFTGNGFDDIAGRVAETGQWFVAVSNGSNSFKTTLWDAWSPNTPNFTWVDVHVGDFNGDGKADIVGRVLQTGYWYVATSTGGAFQTTAWDAWTPQITWLDVQVGDLTGNGKSDIVGRDKATGAWYVAISTGTAFYTQFWDLWSPGIAWADVHLADLTGDGRDDIIGMVPGTGEWWAAVSVGTAFRTSRWGVWSPGLVDLNALMDVAIADFNDDGKADVAAYDAKTGQWFASLSTGSALTAPLPWATWDPTKTWVNVQVGDFNGDGRADIVARDQATGQWRMNLSNGSAFVTSIWGTWPASDPRFANLVDVRHGNFA